jgi:hypothetical protein
VQTVCQRRDGSTVVLCEHDDDNPQWFGDRPATMAECSGKRCRLVNLQNQLAATWTNGSRQITAIGLKDAGELEKLAELAAWRLAGSSIINQARKSGGTRFAR